MGTGTLERVGSQIRRFHVSDLEALEPRPIEERVVSQVPELWSMIRDYASRGVALTLLWDDRPIACGGVILLWPGLGEGWMYLGSDIREHAFAFHRGTVRMIRRLSEELHLRRLQVTAPLWHTETHGWLERLGFREESRMPHYGPEGETYIRFVLFPEESPCRA